MPPLQGLRALKELSAFDYLLGAGAIFSARRAERTIVGAY